MVFNVQRSRFIQYLFNIPYFIFNFLLSQSFIIVRIYYFLGFKIKFFKRLSKNFWFRWWHFYDLVWFNKLAAVIFLIFDYFILFPSVIEKVLLGLVEWVGFYICFFILSRTLLAKQNIFPNFLLVLDSFRALTAPNPQLTLIFTSFACRNTQKPIDRVHWS